jgi:hypothetical protein
MGGVEEGGQGMSYVGPGIYRHYKGGHYRVLGVAQHEYTGADLVIYHSYDVTYDLTHMKEGVEFVARPLSTEDGEDAFNEQVRVDDIGSGMEPRFTRVAG